MPELFNPRLVLTPVDKPGPSFNLSELTRQLQQLNFLAELKTTEAQYQCYEIGEDFLHQISFLGCSPTLFSDQNDQDTFISIIEHDDIAFSHSSEIPPPRCPHCQKTDKNWKQYQQQWDDNKNSTVSCPSCGKTFSFTEMKWKKNGGYGRLLIQVHGVQENLAVPNPAFLDALKQITETEWEYFFADH